MNNEITLNNEGAETTAVYIPNQSADDKFMQDINVAILSGQITEERMNALLDIKKRMTDEKNKNAFNLAKSEMQPNIPIIMKDSRTDKAAYASFEAIMEKVAPVLGKFGFSLSHRMSQNNNQITITTTLTHKLGHSETVEITLPTDTSGSKNAVQAIGSSQKYGMRYNTAMLLNIATKEDDDDGNKGGGQFITPTQESDLEMIISQLPTTERQRFLGYMKVSSLIDIKASDYAKGMSALQNKAKELGIKL